MLGLCHEKVVLNYHNDIFCSKFNESRIAVSCILIDKPIVITFACSHQCLCTWLSCVIPFFYFFVPYMCVCVLIFPRHSHLELTPCPVFQPIEWIKVNKKFEAWMKVWPKFVKSLQWCGESCFNQDRQFILNAKAQETPNDTVSMCLEVLTGT